MDTNYAWVPCLRRPARRTSSLAGESGFAQAGETPAFREHFDQVRHFDVQARVTNYFFSKFWELEDGAGSD
jgi:hypothetical protein